MKWAPINNGDQHQCDDDAMLMHYFSEDDISNAHFPQFWGSSCPLETFLYYCLVLAILLFLYSAALLQHTLMMLGLKRYERQIDAWNRVMNFYYPWL
jgi:hypothetical protein